MSTDALALERLLGDLDWTMRRASRPSLPAGAQLQLPHSPATVVYVVDGEVQLTTVGTDGRPVTTPGAPGRQRLGTGDLLLSTDRARVRLTARTGALLAVAELEPGAGAAASGQALPPVLTLTGFDVLEPAVAALAADLGVSCDLVEHGDGRLGAVCARIITAVVAVAMRTWAEQGCAPRSWLAGVHDPHIGHALEAIHLDPGRTWSLADLAEVAVMSRSAFAARFREVVGVPPAHYLTDVRMELAQRYLAAQRLSVTQTSRLLGYSSDAGFSRAFRRHVGVNPSAWVRDRVGVPA